jgi:FixJ family two-component response regulator
VKSAHHNLPVTERLLRIFVAEEDAAARDELIRELRVGGYEVVSCANGAELFHELLARVSLPGARRSIVVAQARLPVVGALRILHSLRVLDVDIPVILMTRLPDSEIAEVAKAAGAAAVLRKPVRGRDLCRLIADIATDRGIA